MLKIVNRTKPGDLWRRVTLYKRLLVIFSFLAAYVLGANTVGLITAVAGFEPPTVLDAILAILEGCIFLSEREIRRVGEDSFFSQVFECTHSSPHVNGSRRIRYVSCSSSLEHSNLICWHVWRGSRIRTQSNVAAAVSNDSCCLDYRPSALFLHRVFTLSASAKTTSGLELVGVPFLLLRV